MQIGIISLFPEIFSALDYGVIGRAIDEQKVVLHYFNPRDYSTDKHQRVDDRPYGGGAGMVMQVQPIQAAITCAKACLPTAPVIYLTPQGRVLQQDTVQLLSKQPSLIFLNGRYEGVDERLIAAEVDVECSIGDYVLSGGEFANLVLIDAITRCLPGVLGHADSAVNDSFTGDRLDYPHYTRPAIINGMPVPAVLTSGDHQAIARWRLKQALGRTWQRRPELLSKQSLSFEERLLLDEFIDECEE